MSASFLPLPCALANLATRLLRYQSIQKDLAGVAET